MMTRDQEQDIKELLSEMDSEGDGWFGRAENAIKLLQTELAAVREELKQQQRHDMPLERITGAHTNMTATQLDVKGAAHRMYAQGGQEACYICTLLNQLADLQAKLASDQVMSDEFAKQREAAIKELERQLAEAQARITTLESIYTSSREQYSAALRELHKAQSRVRELEA